ncbi:class I SAM-dependent methyltransferase [Falsiroseomonas oryzae]|uniref:class I SAM-dependent methyltransferase n=1 Tax=Falsiroseomonas oryzae TaxID=2766473 RepID=UPI0022EA6A69|nr:class I SAM-dependent methyltransferase [Roseomonas sp. MO-31]
MSWGDGYVTDINYDAGYYREQSPAHLRLACLLCGVAWDVPEEGAHYLELGCGQGMGALVVAAANPSWRVTAIDFHPAHIAAARALAREAGLTNVTFLEADLSDFAESAAAAALPEADIVTSHGVWSWVSPTVRAGIVRLLRAKLRAGGVAHLSYNALPGWQGMLAMQRLVRETGLRLAQRSDRQAQAGFEVLHELVKAEASTLTGDARLTAWLRGIGNYSATYLAHEFMNGHWSPCWHSDVVAALSEARLEFVGSGMLLDNFPELGMTAAQRAIYERFEDSQTRELVKDVCLGRTLRHDVFVRGARRMGAAGRDAALRELTLALCIPADRVVLEVQVAAGKAQLAKEFYGPVVRMLAEGPAAVGALLKAPGAVATKENPAELAGLLTGTRQAVPVWRPGAPASDSVLRLNAALARRMGAAENLSRPVAAASAALGAGMPCSVGDLFVAGRALAGDDGADVAPWVATLGSALDEENQGRLREALERARDQMLPLLRQLGCLPA